MSKSKGKTTAKDICLIGLMVAVIEACKIAMASLPNIELTSFWLILFTLYFGKRIFLVVPVFILIEGAIFGFGLWWIMYLYSWPLLVLITFCFRKVDSALLWAVIAGAFGLAFGALCALPNIVIGTVDGSLLNGFRMAFNYWISGIPFDLLHCGGNFALMLVLYRPVSAIMKKLGSRDLPQSEPNA